MSELYLESPELRALDLEIDNLVLGMHAQNMYMESVGVYTEAATVESIKKSLSLIIERVVKFLQDLADGFKTGVNKTIAEIKKLNIGNNQITASKNYPKEVDELKKIAQKIAKLLGNPNVKRAEIKAIEMELAKLKSKKGKAGTVDKINMKLNDITAASNQAEELTQLLATQLDILNGDVGRFAKKLGATDAVAGIVDKNNDAAKDMARKAKADIVQRERDNKIKEAQDAQYDMIILARDAAKESARTSMEMDRLMQMEIRRARMEQMAGR